MNWKEVLTKFRGAELSEQQAHKHEIIEAWRQMWLSDPTEKEFAEYTGRLILCSEMLYICATIPLGGPEKSNL